ncbi:MAG: ferredoxin:thioredoxin reductase [Candidatus Adiutrix sp.]|nr:ferredoxin:thioredoxin reductase [Candidatus Adiutrix sp.]
MAVGQRAAELYETLAPAQAAQGYAFNPDKAWTLAALAGLLVNEARHGYGSCPGRLATGQPESDRAIVCPCDFRAEDVAKYGRCHCHLYFSPGAAGRGRLTPVPDRWLRQSLPA